jgi:hypothetical protein
MDEDVVCRPPSRVVSKESEAASALVGGNAAGLSMGVGQQSPREEEAGAGAASACATAQDEMGNESDCSVGSSPVVEAEGNPNAPSAASGGAFALEDFDDDFWGSLGGSAWGVGESEWLSGAAESASPFPHTWEACDHCASNPWADGTHTGTALHDDDGVARCHVVAVDPDTSEYASVVLPLIQHGVTIVDVHRVQNQRTYTRFHATKMADSMMPWDTYPRDLWHGTTATQLGQLLLEGLDQRVASRGHFGRGLYFSDHPGKAHRYTSKRSTGRGSHGCRGIRTMLRCKVLMGKIKEYPRGVNDPSLLREPAGHDSVSGNISGQHEMVVYNNDRVYIDYVVRYSVSPVVPPAAQSAPPAKSSSVFVSDCVASIADELRSLVSAAECFAGSPCGEQDRLRKKSPRTKRLHSLASNNSGDGEEQGHDGQKSGARPTQHGVGGEEEGRAKKRSRADHC